MMKLTMEKGEECNIGLSLGVGIHEDYYKTFKKHPRVRFDILFPPKPQEDKKEKTAKRSKNTDEGEEESMVRDEYDNTRKKLTLTKEQSTLLEESFRENHTLNLTQKKALADRLNLRPRQVEVWFQNRRARNKLKQTEVDCEMLRKWCESLSDENRRLTKELQELRSAKMMSERKKDSTIT